MFSIGEFSRIARVTPRQLRHYEELGLFQPERIDPETGYRFYSAYQLPRLNRILALKDLGLSLPQIRRLLDKNISPEELRGMLTMRKAQIEQTLRDELERVRSIETRLRLIEEQGELSDDVVLKAIPARTFLSTRQIIPSKEEGFALMAEIQRALPRLMGKSVIGQFALRFPSESFEIENIDVEMGFQCVAEGLAALSANRATHIPGNLNRIMAMMMPRSFATRMYGSMMRRTIAGRNMPTIGALQGTR